jgi:NADH-quinone oxidoreductase subunit C
VRKTAVTGTGGAAAAAAGAARSAFEERVLAELGAMAPAVSEPAIQKPHRLIARVKAGSIVDVSRRLKLIGFDHLSCETCVDYESEIEMVYLLWSYKEKCLIELRSRISGTEPKAASLVPVWTGAEFHEREAYDMFGVIFEGCPNLRRVLLPDEWTLFPFRKSFKIESIHEKRKRAEAEKAKAAKAAAAAAAPKPPAPPAPPAPAPPAQNVPPEKEAGPK